MTGADHIPFVTGEDVARLSATIYRDSAVARVPLDRADKLQSRLPSQTKTWLDPCVDGMDDLDTRRPRPGRPNSWFTFMATFPHFEKVGESSFHAKPVQADVFLFVKEVLDRCARQKPAWITVPQLPLVGDSERNRINRALAAATGKWKSATGFSGRLILPVIFTNQAQVNGKTARNPKVQAAERCYHEARADGFWVVDKSLADDSGSATLRNKRFPGLIQFHEEINERIPSKIRIAGPYWGLNLVLWARGLVDFPAIGVGSGYQYFLAGGHAQTPSSRVALLSLKRRVGVGRLATWLDGSLAMLSPSHPAHSELSALRKSLAVLTDLAQARRQVATVYKAWFDAVASTPKAGRSMALFQSLSEAYALGRSLPDFQDDGTSRRPESVAEPLMLSCL